MSLWSGILAKYGPQGTAEKARVGQSLQRMKGVHEFLAGALEATKDLPVTEALASMSPWAEAIGTATAEALPPVKFLLSLFKELGKIDDPGDLGYLAATLAYQRAVEQALPEVLQKRTGGPPGPKARKAALTSLRAADAREAYDFSTFTFRNALDHDAVQDSDAFLATAAPGLGLNKPAFRRLLQQVHSRFVPNLKGILSHGSTRERFAPFRDLMELGTEEERAYDALLEHADYQRWLFEEKPVLGREPFSLAQVYVSTDCGALTWGEINEGGKERSDRQQGPLDPFLEKNGGRHDVVEAILDLIAGDTSRIKWDAKSQKEPIVLQGVAGSGKSSLTLSLCWELVRAGLRPIRIELRDLDTSPGKAVEEVLPMAVRLTDEDRTPSNAQLRFGKELFLDNSIFETESVLFRGAQISPYVLILDGWDEISVGASEGYQQQVARMLSGIRTQFFRQRTKAFPVRIVLTGRPSTAVQESGFLREQTPILTLRDLSPDQLEAYVAKVDAATDPTGDTDPPSWSLSNVDALPPVLKRYRKAFTDRQKQADRAYRADSSLEILGLPLLAHLALRLLAERPEDAKELLADTTALYRSLVDLVVPKAGKAPEAELEVEDTAMLWGDELRSLLRGTAEAMTVLGQEAISHDELATRLNLDDCQLESKVQGLSENRVLARLMIAFFFKGGLKQLGCEFSHKSFREYLFAEQVVQALKDYGRGVDRELPVRDPEHYWQDFAADDPRRDLCRRLAFLLGPQWLTDEINLHVQRLLSWEIERSLAALEGPPEPGSLSILQWRNVRDGLADLWDWWGEGVHLRPQPVRENRQYRYRDADKPLAVEVAEHCRDLSSPQSQPTPPRTTTIDGHLGDSLLRITLRVHVLFSAHESPHPQEQQHRRYQTSYGPTEDARVCFAPSGSDGRFFAYYSARINAAGYRPGGWFPFRVNLKGVDLTGANLNGANLQGVELNGANLTAAVLSGSRLILAHLNGANLREAVLTGADLRGADLQGADLEGADFRLADLSEANLIRANLNGAKLNGAKLQGANLRGADLQGADLQEADLTRTVLTNAEITKVQLRDTHGKPREFDV